MNFNKLQPSPQRKVVGVGVNDVPTPTIADGIPALREHEHHYRLWAGLLRRLYKPPAPSRKQDDYQGYTVSDDWKVFSNFKAWIETQDWKGNELDILLRGRGSRVYGADTCAMIPKSLRMQLTVNTKLKSVPLPAGVTLRQPADKSMPTQYKVAITYNKKSYSLGTTASIEDATIIYGKAKSKVLQTIASGYQPTNPLHTYINEYVDHIDKQLYKEAKMWQEYMDSQTH